MVMGLHLYADMVHQSYLKRKDELEARFRARQQVPVGSAGTSDVASAAAAAAGTSGASSQQPAAGQGHGQILRQHTPTTSFAVPGGALLLTDTVLGSGESGDVMLGWCVRPIAAHQHGHVCGVAPMQPGMLRLAVQAR
jgi:hypothetical protein